IVSGQGTNSINVQFGGTNGTITVKGVNSCGSGVTKSITVTLAVPIPAGLNATGITSNSALLSWTPIGSASYNVQYKPVSSGTWATISTASSSVTVNSLSPLTDYEFQVQAVCPPLTG